MNSSRCPDIQMWALGWIHMSVHASETWRLSGRVAMPETWLKSVLSSWFLLQWAAFLAEKLILMLDLWMGVIGSWILWSRGKVIFSRGLLRTWIVEFQADFWTKFNRTPPRSRIWALHRDVDFLPFSEGFCVQPFSGFFSGLFSAFLYNLRLQICVWIFFCIFLAILESGQKWAIESTLIKSHTRSVSRIFADICFFRTLYCGSLISLDKP